MASKKKKKTLKKIISNLDWSIDFIRHNECNFITKMTADDMKVDLRDLKSLITNSKRKHRS